MAALTTLNITEKNANNSLSVTVKVNVTKEGVFTTTLSKEDVDKIHSYGIKLPTNRLGNEGHFNSIALSDLESQIREVLKRCLSYKIVEEVPVIKYQLETNCMFSYDKKGNIVPNPSKEWTGGDENGEWRDVIDTGAKVSEEKGIDLNDVAVDGIPNTMRLSYFDAIKPLDTRLKCVKCRKVIKPGEGVYNTPRGLFCVKCY